MSDPLSAVTSLLDAWQEGDTERYVELFADPFESIHPFGRTLTRSELRDEIEQVAAAWAERSYSITDSVVDDDKVALAYTMTLVGSGRGFAGEVELPAIVMATIHDGKIRHWREVFDPGRIRAARIARPTP